MSNIIDHRVVEMRFDNKQFEAGAKQTMGTLDKLKEALKLPDSGKALDNLGKAAKGISLDGIAAGVEALNKRFSTLGIVGMRVIENITDGLMNRLKTAVDLVTDSIVSGGIKRAMNIENAHFQLQALLKDESKVQAVMANAMESVDGTAYAYDEAAKAASQFAASGIQAGEEMLGALKGITGVAAMTNSSFEDISRIFTTVAGNGRLMGDQLLQLSSRGLNAASTLADYFREVRGQANMTEAEIRDMVSHGEISFKDFSEAMTWAFGDSAKRANETFTGALSNMKSALARIGAGFISPLVEQNGELVQLFNALRIKINDVKSELVFDEQRSAIAGMTKESKLMVETLSELTKSGKIGFEDITTAILETSKSEEELEKVNEKLSAAYKEVEESGYATVDVMNRFKNEGIDSYKALEDYINGVLNGSIKTSSAVKESVEALSNTEVTISDVIKMAQEGQISYDLFTNAIVNASGAANKESKLASEGIKQMMNSIKENGSVTKEALVDLRKSGLNAELALTKYLNGVSDGSIRASYATTTAVKAIKDNAELADKSILELAENGVINYDMLQSAMEEFYGEEKTLSKQFTDFFLDNLHILVEAVNNLDMTKPMEAFYYGIESIKNLAKGLWSVLKPLGGAFSDVFFSFNMDDVINFAAAVERLTAKMKLSEEGSKDLRDAAKGLFSVLKLGIDIFIKLLGVIIPINKPISEMGGGFLGLAGATGRALTSFAEMVRRSEMLKKALDLVSSGFSKGMDALSKLIKIGKDFISSISKLEGSIKLIDAINHAFERLSNKATPYVDAFVNSMDDMFDSMFSLEEINLDSILDDISKALSNLADAINNFSFKNVEDALNSLNEKLRELFMSNEGFSTFINNLKKYGEELKEAFTFDNLMDRVDHVMEVFGKFFNWIKDTIGPAFEEFNVGSTIAGGGGLGIIYAMIKAAKAFENFSEVASSAPEFLDSLKGTLTAYQKDLKAEALIKTAGAIAILAGALVLLSFTDTDKVLEAAVALSTISGTLLFGISKLLETTNKGKELNNALTIFSKGLSKSLKNLSQAVKIKAMGSALKDFGKTILMIGGTIIALALMYRKDPEATKTAAVFVGGIAGVMVAIQALSGIMGRVFKGNSGFKNSGAGMLMISASLFIVVGALNRLFKMEIPSDWKTKVGLLAACIVGVGALAMILAKAGNKAQGGSLKTGPILALTASLYVVVLALDKLFKMELPYDWKTKVGILAGIFVGLSVLMVAMGEAAKLSGGAIKAAGTILAMAAFVVVVTGSLMVLSVIPGDKLLKGAISLGVVLLSLAGALAGASKISDKNTYKAVLAMAINVGVITAALAILSMVPFSKLLKAATVLGAVLLTMALNFKEIGTIKSDKALPAILAMTAATTVIAVSLYELAKQPWEGLLAAAAAMSVTLLAFSKSFEMILGKRWSDNNVKKIGTFLALTLAVIPIGTALGILAKQPWEGLLAAAAALSGTLLAMSAIFLIISKTKVDLNTIVTFGAAVAAACLVAIPLAILANQPVDGMLAATISLSAILIALTSCLAILTLMQTNIASASSAALGLVAFIGVIGGAMLLLGALFTQDIVPLEGVLDKGMEIMIKIGDGLGRFFGAILGGVIEQVSLSLPSLGSALSTFWEGAGVFFDGISTVSDDAFSKMLKMSGAIIALTAAELIAAIGSFLGAGFTSLGAELSGFMIAAMPFFLMINQVNPESLNAVKNIGSMILALTAADVISGVGSFLGLSGSFSDFGKELEEFGPHIKTFAEDVKDVKPEAVQGAASAAEIMANMAKKLPGTDGLVQKIFGEKSLSEFGEELEAFGPAIKEFGDTVKDVKPEAVEGAAAAAQIMADMASKLPNSGGLAAKILGDNKLSDFGKELEEFGPHIMNYADTVAGLQPDVVTASANAALALSELASNLPNSGGLLSWFSGDNDIDTFGKQLEKFGKSLSGYYTSVSGLDLSRLGGVITEVRNLISLATDAAGIDTSGLAGLGDALKKMGNKGIEAFIQEFTDSKAKVIKAIDTMISYAISALKDKDGSFKERGTAAANVWMTGIRDRYGESYSTGETLAIRAISALQLKISEFSTVGSDSGGQYVEGISSKQGEANASGNSLGTNALDGTRSTISGFNTAGVDAGSGFINGLGSMLGPVRDAGRALGQAALDAAKKALDEHSPSKKMGEVGENAGLGFINKLMLYVSKAAKAGEEIGEATIKGASSKMSGISQIFISELDNDPVIKPTVDLENIQRSIEDMNKMFNEAINISADNATITSKSMNIRSGNNITDDSKTKEGSAKTGNVYEFNQYNYSPKALSRIDIYRQTRNQFSSLERIDNS